MSADRKCYEDSNVAREKTVRINAMKRRDQLEGEGYGDQLMELQDFSCPVVRVERGFKIDMCFEYEEDDLTMVKWYQGTVKRLVKYDKVRKFMVVE